MYLFCVYFVCVCVSIGFDLHACNIAGELQDQHTSLDKPGEAVKL